MSYEIHKEVYKGFTIRIAQDEDPMNPLTDCDGEPDIIGWHRRYDFLTDKSMKNVEPEEFLDMAEKNKWIYLPVFMYEHGGRAFSTAPFSCQWDSGQLGFIYWTKEKVEIGQGPGVFEDPAKREFLEKQLRTSLKTYEDWAEGNCWGYIVEDEEGEEIESCWGFLGDYDEKDYSALTEARSQVDWHVADREKKRKEKAAADFPLIAEQLETLETKNVKGS